MRQFNIFCGCIAMSFFAMKSDGLFKIAAARDVFLLSELSWKP
jgi:hypothetical protein